MVFESIISVITYDIPDTEYSSELIFEFDTEEQENHSDTISD